MVCKQIVNGVDEEEGQEGDEEEKASLGCESFTTAASSLSTNVCKICHCGEEVSETSHQ